MWLQTIFRYGQHIDNSNVIAALYIAVSYTVAAVVSLSLIFFDTLRSAVQEIKKNRAEATVPARRTRLEMQALPTIAVAMFRKS